MAESFQPKFVDLVRVFTRTSGTAHFAVGAAVTGFRSFHSALAIGDRFYYCAIHGDRPSEREIGRGTLRADGTIAREPVDGTLTNFSAGTKSISLVAAAEWFETAPKASDIVAVTSFTAQAATAVTRSIGSKLDDVVSVRDFGAAGNGSADDSAAMTAAFQHGCATGVPIFVPPGTYLVEPNALILTSASHCFTLFGAGAASVIKIKDGAIIASWRNFIKFAPSSNVELIELRDLVLDNNARGSPPPADPWAYQQSHTIRVEVPSGISVKQVRFQNVVIKDPVADGFNNCGLGTVGTYVVANCAEVDRARMRSSIQFSILPNNVIVTGFTGQKIEFETNAAVLVPTRVHYSNCLVESFDLAGFPPDANSKLVEVYLTNCTTSSSVSFQDVLVTASNCRLRLNSDGRFNRLCAGSQFLGCRFVHPYDAATNSVVQLWPFWATGYRTHVTFDACQFAIDSSDAAITPTGYMIFPQSVAPVANISDQKLTVRNCRFDKRAQGSVKASRCGTAILENNDYAGAEAAVHYGVTSGNAMDVTISGGNFARVSGAAVRGAWGVIDQLTTIGYARLTGNWTGVVKPIGSSSGTLGPSFNNQIISNRRMVMAALPTSGAIGDMVELQQPVEGRPDSYRCTSSSAAAPSWRMLTQAGVARGTTADRPAGLTGNDNGCRYLDTTLATAGKPIHWSASQWIDATGATA